MGGDQSKELEKQEQEKQKVIDNAVNQQKALDRARYEALVKQNERDIAAKEEQAQADKRYQMKLEEAALEKANAEKRAQEEKLKAEREKADNLKESLEKQLKMEEQKNQAILAKERETAQKFIDYEKNLRESEAASRKQSELNAKKELEAARLREEESTKRAAAEVKAAMKNESDTKDEAHRRMLDLKDKSQQEINRHVQEHQQKMAAKEAENEKKLERIAADHKSQEKAIREEAQKREQALHQEKKEYEKKYNEDMANKDKMSKEERDQMTNTYQANIAKKDAELTRIQDEITTRVHDLHVMHEEAMKEAKEEQKQLQTERLADLDRLHREKEEVLANSVAREKEVGERMLQMQTEHHQKELALTGRSDMMLALQSKQEMEVLRLTKYNEEVGPIKDAKGKLLTNARESCALWRNVDSDEANDVKKQIIQKAKAITANISELLITIEKSSYLGEKKKEWQTALRTFEKEHARSYEKNVRKKEFMEKDFPDVEKLESDCEKLQDAIELLPDMEIISLEHKMDSNAQQRIDAQTSRQGAIGPANKADSNGNIEQEKK